MGSVTRTSHHPVRAALVGLVLASVGSLAPLAASPAAAKTLLAVPVRIQATDAAGAQLPGGTQPPRISADGRWLAYSDSAKGVTYVKDLLSGSTSVVSLTSSGAAANQPTAIAGISADGSSVAFTTPATNMGLGAATQLDLYIRNRTTKKTVRVNYLPGSSVAVPVNYFDTDLSASGGVAVFASSPGGHVYRRVLATNATDQVDVSSFDQAANATSEGPMVSADGRYVSFTSAGTNLVTGDGNGAKDVFRRDAQLDKTILVSTGDNGPGNGNSLSSSISADGSRVAFQSDSTNLIDGDTNGFADVWFRDLTTASTFRVSESSLGVKGNGNSTRPRISGDGKHVVFQTTATTFEDGPSVATLDTYDRDVVEGYTSMVGMNGSTKPNKTVFYPVIDRTGSTIAFGTDATNLIAGDTNGHGDAYAQAHEYIGPYDSFDLVAAGVTKQFGGTTASGVAAGGALANGRLTPTHLISTLAHAPGWAVDREPVARLYQAFFLREPDVGGLNHWVNKHKGGLSLSKIAGEFAKSSEFKTKYGSVSNEAFVTLVYSNVLQRKPDSAGLAHWVAKLAGGMTRGDVMVQFSESSEGKRFLAPEVDATLIGQGLFKGKLPTKALWTAAVKAAKDDDNRAVGEQVALTYLTSPAYTA